MNDLNIPDRAAFKPFTRVVNAPPGWPWDQMRVAQLEAQHTSPVAGDDVGIHVRRLGTWRPGQAGRFVAIYLRGVDKREGLKFDIEVQGQRVSVDLPSRQEKEAQSLNRAWVLGFAAVLLVSMAAMGMLAMQRRDAAEENLAALETQMTRKVREAEGISRAKADATALAELGLEARTIENALADLNVLSLKRDTSVSIEAYHWNRGLWAVEARGDKSPLGDTTPMKRSTKPVRKGIWLWVVDAGTKP